MPRIRDAIRRTLNRRMHCPFVRDYDAIELGLVVLFVTPNIALRLVACHFEIIFTKRREKKGRLCTAPFPRGALLIISASSWGIRLDRSL
jgi:hypothetical protein